MNPPSALPPKRKWQALACLFPALIGLGFSGAHAAAPVYRGAGAPDHIQEHGVDPDPDFALSEEEELESDALAHYAEGLINEDQADTDGALEHYRQVLTIRPGFTELAVKVAFELANRGEVADAISTLKDASKASPKEAVLPLCLSQLYLKHLKKPDQAIKYAQRALELDPNEISPYLALYEIHASATDEKRAMAVLDRASRAASKDPQFWLKLGEIYSQILIQEGSELSPSDAKKLNAIFAKAISFGPKDPTVAGKVGDYFVLSGQVKESIPLYLKVIDLKKGSRDPLLARTRDKLARAYRAIGKPEEAIEVLKKLIEENPLRYDSYEELAELYEEQGDYQGALNNYRQTLLLDSSQWTNFLRVSEMELRVGEVDRAVETLETARKRFSDVPQVVYSLAITLSQAKRHAESLALFEQVLKETKDTEEAESLLLTAPFYFAYGAAAEQAGQIEKAAELLKKSLAVDESNAQVLNYLGFMWVDRGLNLEEAGALIRRALEIDPDNGAYLDSLGWYHFKRGEFEKALVELLKAADRIKPEDAVVYDHLGDTYSALGQSAKAIEYWEKAAKVDPKTPAYAQKAGQARKKIAGKP